MLELTYETDSRSIREPTEEPDEENDYDQKPYLVLRFNNSPKNYRGLIVGKNLKVNIILPKFKSVSLYYFALTFNK